MTHKDIYTKYVIEYDKANITSSYPSLTKYEIATLLDKAYLALIAQKVTGNNARKATFESDIKAIEDLRPLLKVKQLSKLPTINYLAKNESIYNIPTDPTDEFLYYVQSTLLQKTVSPKENPVITASKNVKLVTHDIAAKFKITDINYPWVKSPVAYLDADTIHVLVDSSETTLLFDLLLEYLKKPLSFILYKDNTNNPEDDDNTGGDDNPVKPDAPIEPDEPEEPGENETSDPFVEFIWTEPDTIQWDTTQCVLHYTINIHKDDGSTEQIGEGLQSVLWEFSEDFLEIPVTIVNEEHNISHEYTIIKMSKPRYVYRDGKKHITIQNITDPVTFNVTIEYASFVYDDMIFITEEEVNKQILFYIEDPVYNENGLIEGVYHDDECNVDIPYEIEIAQSNTITDMWTSPAVIEWNYTSCDVYYKVSISHEDGSTTYDTCWKTIHWDLNEDQLDIPVDFIDETYGVNVHYTIYKPAKPQ